MKYDGKDYETDIRLVTSINGKQITSAQAAAAEFRPGDRVSIKAGKSKCSKTWLGVVVDDKPSRNIVHQRAEGKGQAGQVSYLRT